MFGNVKLLQRKGPIRGITCNGGLGTGIKKNRLFYKSNSDVAKHSFVVLYIVSCVVAIKLINFEFKLLSAIFCLKSVWDFVAIRVHVA